MLQLIGTNAAGVAGFLLAHEAAAHGVLGRLGLVAAIFIWLVAVTAFWVHVETRPGRQGGPLARVGRITVALVVVMVAAPALVLMPLFALQEELPSTAGMTPVVVRTMTILLKALGLIALVNLAGVITLLVGAVAGWRRPAT